MRDIRLGLNTSVVQLNRATAAASDSAARLQRQLTSAGAADMASSLAGSGKTSSGGSLSLQGTGQADGSLDSLLDAIGAMVRELQPKISGLAQPAQSNAEPPPSANATALPQLSQAARGQATGGSLELPTAENTPAASQGGSQAVGSSFEAAIAQIEAALRSLAQSLGIALPGGQKAATGEQQGQTGQAGASGAASATKGVQASAGAGLQGSGSAGELPSSGGTGSVKGVVGAAAGSLAANKQTVYQAAKKAGATDEQARVALAVAMLETQNIDSSQGDKGKSGSATNFSALNMSKDMLERMGWNPETGPDLNDQANLPLAVSYMVKAMKTYGTDGFLAFMRGGATGLANGSSYDVGGYSSAIKEVSRQLAVDPSRITDNLRYAADVGHV